MGGRKPYGFDLEPVVINNVRTKKLKPVSEEIEQIKYIFDTYAVENVSLGRLLKNLIENDIKPISGGGWTTAKLSTILKNPIYVKADNRIYEYFQRYNTDIISSPEDFDGIHGVQVYGRTKHQPGNSDWSDIRAVVMTHEGVVDADVWIRCQQKLFKNKQIGNAVSNKTSWLAGKIVCGRCGRTMTTIKGKIGSGDIRRYFNCTGKSHYKDCRGPNRTVYAEILEDLLYDEISKKLDGLKEGGKQRQKTNNPVINELRNKIKSLELAETQIADTLTRPEVSTELIEILSKRATKLKGEKTEIMLKIDELESKTVNVKNVINLSRKWKTASFEEKRGVAGILINKIIIGEDGSTEIVWNI